jgi:AcrR family transcriptional regulator
VAKAGPRKPRTSPEAARAGLIEAAIVVLARDGFARTSARAVAAEAGGTNGLIFYHFGSMDGLLAATAEELSERRIARVKEALGGDEAITKWPARLGDTIRAEARNAEGVAVVELMVGARTSPELAEPVTAAIDRSIRFATAELEKIFGDSPWAQLIPVDLVAELGAAAFFGLELFTQAGREVDIDRIARYAALGVAQLPHLAPAAVD